MNPIILGVDTGNRCMKTRSHCFVSGIQSCGKDKPIYTSDLLKHNGLYYVPSQERIAYMQDKTGSNDYFNLTLIAAAKELKSRGLLHTKQSIPIRFGVGLPPSHFTIRRKKEDSPLIERFKAYFNRGLVCFEYEDNPFSLDIKSVDVFPQGFSATVSEYASIKKEPVFYLVDIGGYTTEVLILRSGNIDPEICESFDFGLIHLYNKIERSIHHFLGMQFKEELIDLKITECSHEDNINVTAEDREILNIIFDEAQKYTSNMIGKLLEFGVDLRTSPAMFIGGGAIRLRPFIEASSMIRSNKCKFQTDIHANAFGYESFIKSMPQYR